MSCFMLNMSPNSLRKLLFCFWMEILVITCLFSSLGFISELCNAADIITSRQSMNDGDILVSSGGRFALGFFSPGTSLNRYVGIWYNDIPAKTVVWVANRKSPVVTNTSGRLVVVTPGRLVLLNDANTPIWSSNTSTSASLDPIAQLLDNGNLVVRDENDDKAENFLWQSFDYLTDTLLPGMKLGRDFVTGLERYLSSWKSDDDPAPGDYTYYCDPTGYPQATLKKGPVIQYRTGPWNGLTFSGTQNLRPNPMYRFYLVFNEKEVYYGYELNSHSVISRLTLNHSGVIQRWTWVDRTKEWIIYLTAPTDNCDTHSLCGAYGRCNIENNPACGCLDKFVPKYQTEWDEADWSNGCKRRAPLDCKSDGFLNYSGIKLPDSQYTWYNKSMSLEECKKECLRNCSCVAYANLNISNGAATGCLLWVNDLLDIRQYSGGGQDIYVRMASSDLDISVPLPSSHKDKGKVVKVLVPLLLGLALVGLALTLYVFRKKKKSVLNREEAPLGQEPEESYPNESQNEELVLPAFGFSALANATNNFSINRKIGEGGFGSVYKGLLEDGQEIAVKRLSMNSIQGLDEFKNEVICISKLQHRNLVKLLGCCIQGEEKMLIYEYMPNKSLDYFIFDEKRSNLLDWPKRLNIINGIARGLLYLHQDSRLRIIHRDLKASNILLDFDMNPKISDFGIARCFGGNQTEANTQRVVGTYGYMSPEYAVDGIFSVKSDVFSFGVLVLETVSGKKNRGFSHQEHHHNLLGHAWILQKEGRSLELIDATLCNTCHLSEVLRAIHVGLLCVQQSPEDRPSMSSVVLMLSGEGGLPQPKQPGFFAERNIFEADLITSSTKAQSSSNEVTITLLEGR